jgi:hypothetical protein
VIYLPQPPHHTTSYAHNILTRPVSCLPLSCPPPMSRCRWSAACESTCRGVGGGYGLRGEHGRDEGPGSSGSCEDARSPHEPLAAHKWCLWGQSSSRGAWYSCTEIGVCRKARATGTEDDPLHSAIMARNKIQPSRSMAIFWSFFTTILVQSLPRYAAAMHSCTAA